MNQPQITIPNKRISWIDTLRGIAILLMIPANFSPYLSEPHALWYRILSSYAAPTFIMLSVGMVVLNAKNHTFRYYLVRGGMLMGIGAVLDMCLWHIFPFIAIDILYLIGLSLPVIFLAHRCHTGWLIGIGIFFFIIASLLQATLGYHAAPLEIPFNNIYWPGLNRIFHSWFIDGWFPIFPWLGYAFVGAAFFRILFSTPAHQLSPKLIIFSIVIMLIGFIFLFLPIQGIPNLVNGGILSVRSGYSEIFYPATLPYILTSLGALFLFSQLARFIEFLPIVKSILSLFGRYSLLTYLLHQTIGVYVVSSFISLSGNETTNNKLVFTASVLFTMAIIYLICRMLERIKKFWRPSSVLLQMLFGK